MPGKQPDSSQALALSVLRTAKEDGTLDSSIEKELSELIGTDRAKIGEILESPASAETEKRELTPDQADRLIEILSFRFNFLEMPENEKLRKTLDWADVEKSLRADPEALFSIYKLGDTGGKPQIVAMEDNEFIIEDRSAESPAGRRNLTFDQADAQRKTFGQNVRFQSPDSYMAMQKTGEYDLNSGSWLETDPERRKKTGDALLGGRDPDDGAYVSEEVAKFYNPGFGWRASIRVKKV